MAESSSTAAGEQPPPPPPPAAAVDEHMSPLARQPLEKEKEEEEKEEEEEYLSDADDLAIPAMRRREASDDEGGDGSGGEKEHEPRGRVVGSDPEYDGQGAPEVYDDDEGEEEEYYDEEEEEDFKEEAVVVERSREEEVEEKNKEGAVEEKKVEEGEGNGEQEEEEKKENEPFAVPTTGAFYMHDDRFQANGRGGRHRRTFGGKKLWDTKDDQAWVHDRFEEMNLQDSRYEMSRGRRGRGGGGRTRGTAHGAARGGKHRPSHDNGNNQDPKFVRGRGPRRYETFTKNNREIGGTQRRQPARAQESSPNASKVRELDEISNVKAEAGARKKNVIASSLNSASPPFYPSGTSNQDFPVAPRRGVQTGISSKVLSSSVKMDNNSVLQSGSKMRGKTTFDSTGHDRVYFEDSVRSSSSRSVAPPQMHSSSYTTSMNPGQSSNVQVHAGGMNTGVPPNNQPMLPGQQASRFSALQQTQMAVIHSNPLHRPAQPAARMPSQQLGQRSGSQSVPPPQHLSISSVEDDENGSFPSSNKSKAPLGGTGKTSNQAAGRGSIVYSGAQVIGGTGAVSLAQGEQNFPGTPALLPVMQFSGQHPGGLGVPAVGMALPGYVAQQQLGLSNSEMSWLPLLAGATGAFGASYCPPYIALDPSFYSQPSGQTSTSVSSREGTPSKAVGSPPRNVLVNEEIDQRQNKPRRYSEMNFGQ